MARVIWTTEALETLDAIGDYLLENSPGQASKVMEGIVAAARPLSQFPRAGRVIGEINKVELFHIIHDPYHIVYRIDVDNVFIVTVLHGARDFIAALREMGFE